MAAITIGTEDNRTTFSAGQMVVLTAESTGHAEGFQWKHNGALVPEAINNIYEFTMTKEAAGTYVVAAKVDGENKESSPLGLSLANSTSPAEVPPPTVTASEQPPVFHAGFAVIVALIIILAAVLILVELGLFTGRGGFTESSWAALEGRLQVGVSMSLPMLIIGTVTVLTGLWMTLVEWRGRFKEAAPTGVKGAAIDPAAIIESVGKLRGATLAMVVGAILLISAAWVAKSAAGTAGGPVSQASPKASVPSPTTAPTGQLGDSRKD